jgi:AcrR family transcriptional regulator
MVAGKRVTDRRVQKTQTLLREALVSLIREKSYDSIAVKEILDRANVGRSTFYMHFKDKDDLLVSGIHDMLRSVHSTGLSSSANRHETLTSFSLPIFEYHDQHRHTGKDRMGTTGRAIVHEHLRRVLVNLIGDEAGKDDRRRRKAPDRLPSDLLVQYVASTFILVLNWWLETRSPLRPNDVNDLFRSLVLPTLAAECSP